MKKLLRPAEVLLLGLAGIIDIYEDLKDPFGLLESGSKNLYGWVPRRYKKHNFSLLVNRQLQTGNIEKVIKNGQVHLRLTRQGETKVRADFPILSLQRSKWDRKWRVVIFDIAELSRVTRDSLRSKLKELGFGMLQKSVWLSPYDFGKDLRVYVEGRRIGDFVYILEVQDILAGNIRLLIDKIWRLSQLGTAYEDLNNDLQTYIASRDRVSKHKYLKLRRRYLELILADPHLPKELLPPHWAAVKVWRLIKSLEV